METKEFYLYTYKELIEKLGEEEAKKKAEFYLNDFLVMYPKTLCVKEGNLMKTYRQHLSANGG